MSCQKSNMLTDLNLASKISLHLDYSNLRYNEVVKVIRNDADALRDALSTKDGAWSMFKEWKNRIYTYSLIDDAKYRNKVVDWTFEFSSHNNPEIGFQKAMNDLEKLALKDESFKFTDANFQHYAYWIKPNLKEYFNSELEFYEYMQARFWILQKLEENWYNIRRHFALRHKNGADYMRILISDMEQGELLSVMKTQPEAWKLEDYASRLKESIWNNLPEPHKTDAKQKEISDFVDYMVPSWKEREMPIKAIESLFNAVRPLAMFWKFTLWTMSWMRLFYVSAMGNSLMLNARTKGIESVVKSDFLEELLEKEGILAGETRLKVNVEFRQSWMEKLLQMAMAVWPDSSILKQNAFWIAAKLLWGWHNMWDILADSYAKKAIVAEAMVVNWINWYNLDLMYDLYKNWALPKEIINDIRRLSHDKYDSFFTNSSTRSRTANRFTVAEKDWVIKTAAKLSFNFMQWYTTRRLGALISWFEMFEVARKEWRIKLSDPSSIKRWLDTEEGAEMRAFIMTSLLASKLAVYVVTNQSENEYLSPAERIQKIKNFAISYNDYLSSTESSIPFRILDSLVEGAITKYVKLDPDGQTREYYGNIPWATYSALSETAQMMMREFNVFNLIPALVSWAQTGWGWDFALEAFDVEMNRITNGQGRFLMDWTSNPYWLTITDEPFDTAANWSFMTAQNNQVMAAYNEIKTIEDISKWMDQPIGRSLLDIFWTIAPIAASKKFYDKDSIVNKEASLNMMMSFIEKDEIANNLYNWIFDSRVLKSEQEEIAAWAMPREWKRWGNIDSLFKDLTSFSNIRKQSDWTLELWSDYGINDTQFEAIEQKLIEQLGPQTYNQILRDNSDKINDEKMAMIRASMDAKIPWSWRLMLAVAAYKDYNNLVTATYWKGKTNNDITFEQQEALQRIILTKYWNQLVMWDQIAQTQLLMWRLTQINPQVLNISPEFQKIANSVTFIDTIIHEQTKKGNLNARYLGSVLSLAGKYTPDSLRLPILEKTFYKIDQMDIPENDKKVLKTGVGLWNVDFLGKIAKDPVLSKKYAATVDNVLNLIYRNQTASSLTPNAKDIEDASKTKTKFNKTYWYGWGGYYWRSWNSYGTSRQKEYDSDGNSLHENADENARAREQLTKKLASLPRPKKLDKTIDMKWHNTSAYRWLPKTPLEKIYMEVLFKELGTAQTQKLENSEKVNNISSTNKAQSWKASYKSKKWKVVKLKLPKSAKFKTANYKG